MEGMTHEHIARKCVLRNALNNNGAEIPMRLLSRAPLTTRSGVVAKRGKAESSPGRQG